MNTTTPKFSVKVRIKIPAATAHSIRAAQVNGAYINRGKRNSIFVVTNIIILTTPHAEVEKEAFCHADKLSLPEFTSVVYHLRSNFSQFYIHKASKICDKLSSDNHNKSPTFFV